MPDETGKSGDGHGVLIAVIGAVGLVAAAAIPILLTSHDRSSASPTSMASTTVSTPITVTSSSTSLAATTASAAVRSGSLFTEITDNRAGTKVFSDPEGDAPTGNSDEIQFDTTVAVACWTPNESTMGSITGFYLVETAPWTGDYAPADTFANGDPVGQPGSTDRDPAVPTCT